MIRGSQWEDQASEATIQQPKATFDPGVHEMSMAHLRGPPTIKVLSTLLSSSRIEGCFLPLSCEDEAYSRGLSTW